VSKVVTANPGQKISFCCNGDESKETNMVLPWTNGYWKESTLVTLQLKEGENTIRFWRENPTQIGVAVKCFILQPKKKYEKVETFLIRY
jgi:hypothetical protein